MKEETHEAPLGAVVENWKGGTYPEPGLLQGVSVRLEPLNMERHAQSLFDAYALDREGKIWTYLAHGPFPTLEEFLAFLRKIQGVRDPQCYAIVDNANSRAIGVASFMRIDPVNGVIEVGSIAFSPILSRTRMATEAMYLMMKRAFDLGYRRYEWKCNALNAASRRAAERLGFRFEGVFRQALVVKGRNRDTAWYSIIDSEWPSVRLALERWLSPRNFDENGRQRQRLDALRVDTGR